MATTSKSAKFHLILAVPLALTGFGLSAVPTQAKDHGHKNKAAYKHACANHKKKKKKKILGTIGGAAVGGFIGRKVDGGRHHETGTIVGAVGGALAGRAIAGKMTSCDRYLQDQAAVRAIETGHTQDWSNTDSGYGGTAKRAQTFVDERGRTCNTITTQTTDQNGNYDPETVILCKNANGTWDRK